MNFSPLSLVSGLLSLSAEASELDFCIVYNTCIIIPQEEEIKSTTQFYWIQFLEFLQCKSKSYIGVIEK